MCTAAAAGWEAAARMLISAVLLSVQCGHSLVKKKCTQIKKKKPCIKVKKQKYKSSNAASFRAVIMN